MDKDMDLVEFEGMIDEIKYEGDNGFIIMNVRPSTNAYGGNTITVKGTLFEPHRKDQVRINGKWVINKKFGRQVEADNIQIVLPSSTEDIYKLLKSKRFMPGIGAKTAKVIAEKYGAKIFDILDNDPDELLTIKGITKKKLDKIMEDYNEKREFKEILQFCATYGISQSQGKKIQEVYGGSAVSILLRNPYLLTETGKGVKGIGFKKADDIALKQGLPRDSRDRILHGLFFATNELAAKKGSTAVKKDTLITGAAEMMEVEKSAVEPLLEELLASKNPVLVEDDLNGKRYIWTKMDYWREQQIALKIAELKRCHSKARLPKNVSLAISEAERSSGISLAPSQRAALEIAVTNKISVITGGPGVGKTTITKCLIKILKSLGNKIRCAAPTGRASKRMKEATNHEAKTIHRLLEFDGMTGQFARNSEYPLEGDVFIFDESSMIDNYMMYCLMDAIPASAKVVFIGDVDQLPSVSAGKVLEDMISSKTIPVGRLTDIFRQAATSKIISSAHAVNHGKMPEIANNSDDDFFFMPTEDCYRCASTILKLVDYIPKRFGCNSIDDVQVLSPKKGSDVGTLHLNELIQTQMNPETKTFRLQAIAREKISKGLPLMKEEDEALRTRLSSPMIMGKESIFAENDKVMQVSNNYELGVFNGEVGVIEAVFPKAKKDEQCVRVRYPDEEGVKYVGYTRDELNSQVSLAYACTIHKSQGSEYPYVIIPVMKTFSIMLQRKLIYTGITRGKKLVVLVGDKEAFEFAVKDHFKAALGIRHTKLKYWLSHTNEIKMAG